MCSCMGFYKNLGRNLQERVIHLNKSFFRGCENIVNQVTFWYKFKNNEFLFLFFIRKDK